ncbi:glycogen debranching enzyme [Cimex lectularius]|uniref:Glycogen debranching enzyme n=1 Tax=Cimex lectularius TaxID=79782 RepID=A0A8I6RHY7_CIMLE|nr:glycogen debranching enzyme [Cimex lectularius]
MELPRVVLTINKDQNEEDKLFRVPKGVVIQIKEGPSLYGHKVKIFTDFPQKGTGFVQRAYRVLDKKELIANWSGSFHYCFTVDDCLKINGQGYILVEPELIIGSDIVTLDCIQCVTYISKNLGPLSTWKKKLQVAKECGYNMIHFTPIQALGSSNSAYSLKDQLKINPLFGDNLTDADILEVVNFIRKEWKILSICDIVLNHTANESPWLKDHPECAYNLTNSPHLRPAYILDRLLYKLSLDVSVGVYETMGLTAEINSEEHLNSLRYLLESVLIPEAKIPECFLVDVHLLVNEFKEKCRNVTLTERIDNPDRNLTIIQDPQFRRLKSTIDMGLALKKFNIYRVDCFDEDTRQKKCAEAFKNYLESQNNEIRNEIENHLKSAVENTIATVRYFRLDQKGPKIPLVTKDDLLVHRYFVEIITLDENAMFTDEAKYIMAHNGWVMDYDPLNNFAEFGSNVYLKRELIVWGDSVKLRYGEKRDDCPYLWDHMRSYVERTVEIFDGIRLDNCHSTPIPVAQYLVDAARVVRPELYVVAELFTNSDQIDNIFINKIGISSLVRESMSAGDSQEVGRLVYRYGGSVIGALHSQKVSNIAHALFMDLTHDNSSPVERKTVYDMLPSTALVSMAACATGSTYGYDQLVPHHINVVKEDRTFMNFSETRIAGGIMSGKCALNKLHYELAKQGFSQVFVDQIDKDIVCVTRFNPNTLDSVVLVAYTAFKWPNNYQTGEGKGVTVQAVPHSLIFEAFLKHKSGKRYEPSSNFTKDSTVINGLQEYDLEISENVPISSGKMVRLVSSEQGTRVNFTTDFQPGSVVALKFVAQENAVKAAKKINEGMTIQDCIEHFSLADVNYALYRCGNEENGNTYCIPGHGHLVYCGIQGIMSVFDIIAKNNDLGHPLCSNIREGSWYMYYTVDRLKQLQSTERLGDKLHKQFKLIDDLPTSLRPWGLYKVLSQVHGALLEKAISLMPAFFKEGDEFLQNLAMCSIQMAGIIKSSPLPPLSNGIAPPRPKIENLSDGFDHQICTTLAAGLPHFSSGYMRSWGRDTFISIKGLLILTHRFDEARYHILGYGGCLRHGLIPNLLDAYDLKPRYNSRDAVWWWLQSIKEYTNLVPNGVVIFKDKVNRLFPTDESELEFVDQPLEEVIQEALTKHFQGVTFRERNAGKEIDEHMTIHGFDNQIGVHPITGFVFGGNEWNCGTWMDKMGSSVEAGTKGKPATPRDGSAVEIVGLSYSVILWLSTLYKKGKYPYNSVTRINKFGETTTWTWAEWADKIKSHFTKEFWVEDKTVSEYVNRVGIYKDSVGATQPWADFRLRPNFLISMVVAPELFDLEKARIALQSVKVLVGPLGMKTLDPTDLMYCGDYDNGNHSTDFKVAHGFNYHQGPEWVWLVGYYLRAKLRYSEDPEGAAAEIKQYLSTHWNHLVNNPWRGLSELTNANGAFCEGACPTQAWSAASIIEVFYDLTHLCN